MARRLYLKRVGLEGDSDMGGVVEVLGLLIGGVHIGNTRCGWGDGLLKALEIVGQRPDFALPKHEN